MLYVVNMLRINRRTLGFIVSGFTLVELLVVISIIALLMGMLLPTFGMIKRRALRLKCCSNLKQVHLAINLYAASNDHFYPSPDGRDPVTAFTGRKHCLWSGRGMREYLRPYIDNTIDANNPSVLFCPADKQSAEKYESTSYAYSMAFYYDVATINKMSKTSDTWNCAYKTTGHRMGSASYPSSKILVGEWFSNHHKVDISLDNGWWWWEGKRNYLLADGHVQYIDANDILPALDGFPDGNLTKNGISGRDIFQ